ncbi:acid sphingomyelinase-like phosphodiesterase 3b [Bacillus rossius redtenbacheri]|uniref:acid sphingomyelinase-like phosphodiesterase 3b n=1 Tax=Bacillus rossius redtenbacheri TaxID=93214 RepID=UPI002FDDFA65
MGIYQLLLGLLFVSAAQAKIGYFWHITDIHYDEHYSSTGNSGKNCWRTDGAAGGARPLGRFGDYNCDSPWALVQSAAKAMRDKHGDNIEFVLWTGDGASYTGGRSSDHQLQVLKNLTDLLRHTFSSQFVFPVLGHEDPNPGLGQSYGEVADLWSHWLPTEALNTIGRGGYYTFEQKGKKLRLVALNTNVYVKGGILSFDDDPIGQWNWLENVLDKSRKSKETVYLVGHIPPGVDERQSGALVTPQASFQEKFNRQYLRLVRKYSDIIVGQFFGHLHSDSFRIIYADTGRPVSWMFIAPALSPRRIPSGANNPGLRLYKFNTDTGQVLDYVQYYLDLVAANQRGQADWQQEYNLTNYYGLGEVSAASLNELAESFITPEGSQLFAKYYRANSVQQPYSSDPRNCDLSCTFNHYCAVTRVDYAEFQSCLEAETSAFSARTSRTPLWGVVATLSFAAACHAS